MNAHRRIVEARPRRPAGRRPAWTSSRCPRPLLDPREPTPVRARPSNDKRHRVNALRRGPATGRSVGVGVNARLSVRSVVRRQRLTAWRRPPGEAKGRGSTVSARPDGYVCAAYRLLNFAETGGCCAGPRHGRRCGCRDARHRPAERSEVSRPGRRSSCARRQRGGVATRLRPRPRQGRGVPRQRKGVSGHGRHDDGHRPEEHVRPRARLLALVAELAGRDSRGRVRFGAAA
jgi:hypothetical protein